jgi:hypothetical protein
MTTIQSVFEKNGSIIGLKLNGSMLSTMNKIDEVLSTKASVEDIEQLKSNVSNKIDFSYFLDYMAGINESITNVVNKLNNLPSQKPVQDFTLSEPATEEELTLLNSLSSGDLYTINGGSAVMVFKDQLVVSEPAQPTQDTPLPVPSDPAPVPDSTI